MSTFSAAASTPVASWYADGPLGDCNNFWGLQRYDVIVRLHQGTAPDGTYTYTADGGSTTIACSGGSCGEDLYVGRDVHSDTLSETVPLVYSVTFNGHTFSGSVIKVRMCYSTHTEENAKCFIDAYVTTPSNTTSIDVKAGGDQCDANLGMARYSVHSMLASLNIVDTPIGYVPQRGPAIAFTATYNQMEHQQPILFDYSNLGPKWTFNWLAYVIDDPATQQPSTTVYVPGGGAETYLYDSGTQTFARHPQSHALLVRLTNPDRYERRFSDGSKQVFGKFQNASYPRKVFMTQWADSTGENVTIDYDTDPQYPLRIKKIRDALGFETNLEYHEPSYPYRITKVAEPSQFGLGRYASFAYTSGHLTKITDTVGIQSKMGYETGTDSINSLTTPYGTTAFARGETGTTRWVEITDPLLGKERVEYRDDAPVGATDPTNTVPSGFTNAGLHVANTFYWDKKAMQVAPGDYTKARITHWAKNADGGVSGIVASEKAPLENRVWFRYAGQSDTNHTGPSANPIEVARVLNAGGTTERSQYVYNTLGKMTKVTDPMDRVTSYAYDPANGIDLMGVFQRKPGGLSVDPENQSADKIYGCTYTTSHQPHVVTDAAGQTTTYLYTASNQLASVENARHEITTYGYGDGSAGKPVGCLTSVTSPQLAGGSGASISFTYDSAHRVRTVTSSPDNYAVTTGYDNLDRKTTVTYPDGTYEEFQYTQDFGGTPKVILNLTASRDRQGRWTYRHYNENRQMDSITDPAARTTLYNWCACGSLDSIIDPNGHMTAFHRDLQGRVYQKVFSDSSTIDLLFDGQSAPNTAGTTSRLKSSTDALGRQTAYTYSKDGNVENVTYTNPSGGPPTPSVHYVYDDYHNRLNTMDDGAGHTAYHYYPVTPGPSLGGGRLQDVDGPLQNDTITYTYDELGRTQGQSVNGAAQTVERDPLGRVFHTENALGDFSSTYEGPTTRLQTVSYPNITSVNYFYYGNDKDRRLQALQNLSERETAPLSMFDYDYHPDGEIVTLFSELGGKSSRRWFDYDGARQLLNARDASSLSSATQVNGYVYDNAGNRTSDSKFNPQGFGGNGLFHSYTLNNLNQIESLTTEEGGMVGVDVMLTYDLAGNLVDNGEGKTFEWDAANRLTAINQNGSGQRTEFAYDGLGRRVKITEIGPGVTATIQPQGSDYASFSTAPFTLPAGSYTMTFEISSGDDIILIDSVALNNTLVANGSFETPGVSEASGGFEYQPSGATWSFSSHSGIAFNGSDLTSKNPDAPDGGKQVGFIHGQGKIFQTHSVSAGTYTLSFQAAQGGFNAANQSLQVTLQPSVAGITTKRFVWCGTQICEERDSTGATVTKRFFAEGEQRIGGSDAGSYYYTRDHLGSIREVTNTGGSLLARYDYDPYGNAVVVDGNMSVDFGYTGHYFHAPSGLNLTLYRAYNPAVGRWLSRDPMGEAGGLNLYGYVGNNPVNSTDPLGLYVEMWYNIRTGRLDVYDHDTDTFFQWKAKSGTNNMADLSNRDVGPVPPGYYVVGGADDQDPGSLGNWTWYHLYQPTDNGDWTYSDAGDFNRGQFNLHTGSISHGCITFESVVPRNDPAYPQNGDFDQLDRMLRQTTLFPASNRKLYHGTLTVY